MPCFNCYLVLINSLKQEFTFLLIKGATLINDGYLKPIISTITSFIKQPLVTF